MARKNSLLKLLFSPVRRKSVAPCSLLPREILRYPSGRACADHHVVFRTMALGSARTLMSTSKLPGGKWRPARKAGNLIAICEAIVQIKCWNFDVSQPYWPSRPLSGIALLFKCTFNWYQFVKTLVARRHDGISVEV
jgi:hypothetical protein